MNKERIMIVEDEGIVAMQIKSLLLDLGYEIAAVAAKGEEAVKKAVETIPDLILMDIRLEGEMTGIKAAKLIRDALDIPIIYLTAYADEKTVAQAKLTEPSGFLIKPFNVLAVNSAIEMALYKHDADINRRRVEEELKGKNLLLEQLNEDLQNVALGEYRHRLEKEELLLQQSKMAAMGEMIGAIGHQWRQPLNVIGLLVQSLKDAYEYGELDQALIDRTVDETMKQVYFMSKTIDDFRNFMNPSKKKETFDLKVVTGEVFSLLSAQMKSNYISYSLTCHIHNKTFNNFTEIIGCGECEITSYKNEFKQVILNLVTNAKDAILDRRKKGLMKGGDAGNINIDFHREDKKIIVELTDNGGGIPEENLERIFDSHFTMKEGGTGIGLYITKNIIEKNMGGKLSVANVEGGAKFTIELGKANGV
jgi:signal transduction histidine kinase